MLYSSYIALNSWLENHEWAWGTCYKAFLQKHRPLIFLFNNSHILIICSGNNIYFAVNNILNFSLLLLFFFKVSLRHYFCGWSIFKYPGQFIWNRESCNILYYYLNSDVLFHEKQIIFVKYKEHYNLEENVWVRWGRCM